jgi:hypothetical protein
MNVAVRYWTSDVTNSSKQVQPGLSDHLALLSIEIELARLIDPAGGSDF